MSHLRLLRGTDAKHAGETCASRVALVTLGCAKNQVDSELMLGALANHGFMITGDILDADIAIVNTCGFLKASCEESIDRILEVAALKKEGRLKRLIVTGCLVQRYKHDLEKTLPEVDAFVDLDSVPDIVAATLERAVSCYYGPSGVPSFLYDHGMARVVEGHYAYVKISEGCNHACSFCLIPSIRGSLRSRSLESIRSEVSMLTGEGIREINLIAQDLTAWGSDKTGWPGLAQLLVELDASCGPNWIRLLYLHPAGISVALLEAMRSLPSVCEYLDIPLQHSSEKVLKAMRRPCGALSPRRVVETIRRSFPSIALRTTFIVGFPGETDEDVAELEQFVSEGNFLSTGVFCFSREEGTAAFDMKGQIPEREKQARRDAIMLAQQASASRLLESQIGSRIPVLIEGPHEDTELLIAARARFQAPEVDGVVLINDVGEGVIPPEKGDIGTVEVTGRAGYDLVATWLG